MVGEVIITKESWIDNGGKVCIIVSAVIAVILGIMACFKYQFLKKVDLEEAN